MLALRCQTNSFSTSETTGRPTRHRWATSCRSTLLFVLSVTLLGSTASFVHAQPAAAPVEAEPAKAESVPPELLEMVLSMLKDTDPQFRALALEQIRTELPGKLATAAFAEQLPQLNAESQVALLSALEARADSSARASVLALLDQTPAPPQSVQAGALKALGTLGTLEDLPRLLQTLQSSTPELVSTAASSLVRLPDPGTNDALIAQYPPLSTPAKVETLKIFATRRALSAVSLLLNESQSDLPETRGAAVQALAELLEPEQVGKLLPAILKAAAGSERDAAEKAVAKICSRAKKGDERALPLLDASLAYQEQELLQLLPTLGRVGSPPVLEIMQELLKDPAVKTQAGSEPAVIKALCLWPDGRILDLLIQLHGQHPDLQAEIEKALVRVAPLNDGRDLATRFNAVKTVFDLCQNPADRQRLLQRASAIRHVDTLRYLVSFLDQPDFAQAACAGIVELAHHRAVRETSRAEFEEVLTRVEQLAEDPVVKLRAERYRKNQTWARPK